MSDLSTITATRRSSRVPLTIAQLADRVLRRYATDEDDLAMLRDALGLGA